MRFTSLKVVNLNPDVRDEQIQDLLGEKFSQFLEASITVVKHATGRMAYIDFKTELDAKAALQGNANIAMFGYTSHAMPCLMRPPPQDAGAMADVRDSESSRVVADPQPSHSDDVADTDEDTTDHRQKQDTDRAAVSPPRGRGRARLFNRGGFRRGGTWTRGANSSFGRGRPYMLKSRPSRGGAQKPYLLTKPTHTEAPRQKPYLLTTSSSGKDQSPGESEEPDEELESSRGRPNCTLYIGKMDPSVQEIDLKRLFTNFGYFLDIEIKLVSGRPAYAFVHFLTPDMAELARRQMDGKMIGHTIPRLGFGNMIKSRYLWVGGLGPWTSIDLLRLEFSQFGSVVNVEWPKNRDYAYIEFNGLQDACDAMAVMHGCQHGDPPHQLRVCYASSLQMKSKLNYKEMFPTWPKRPKPWTAWKLKKFMDHAPQAAGLPCRRRSQSRELHDQKSQSREPRSQDSRDKASRDQQFRRSSGRNIMSSTERRRSLDRRRSPERKKRRSHSGGRKRPGRRHRSDSLSRKKDHRRQRVRASSPYTSSISDGSMSTISDTSSESPTDRSRASRKRRRKGDCGGVVTLKSPGTKILRNPASPAPPSRVMRDVDDRTVVLRSDIPPAPLHLNTLSTAAASIPSPAATGFTPAQPLNPAIPATGLPSYLSHIDPSSYYASIYPPPLHMPPPDFYLPPNSGLPPSYQPQMLPPVVPYPAHIVSSMSQQQAPVISTAAVPVASSQMLSSYTTSDHQLPPPRDTYPTTGSAHPPAAAASTDVLKPLPSNGTSTAGVAGKFPKVWSGALVLRNAAFVVDLHLVSGSVLLTNALLGKDDQPGSEADCPVLKIGQRLRLDQPDKLDELSKRLKKAGRVGCSVLLATSAGAQVDDDANVVQQYPLSSLVSYLLQKQVAAVVSLPPTLVESTGVLHAFPPCLFATEFLQREEPGLPRNCPAQDELLVILCQH